MLADTATRNLAYVALTRGRASNHAYLYQRTVGEGDHQHRDLPEDQEVLTVQTYLLGAVRVAVAVCGSNFSCKDEFVGRLHPLEKTVVPEVRGGPRDVELVFRG